MQTHRSPLENVEGDTPLSDLGEYTADDLVVHMALVR